MSSQSWSLRLSPGRSPAGGGGARDIGAWLLRACALAVRPAVDEGAAACHRVLAGPADEEGLWTLLVDAPERATDTDALRYGLMAEAPERARWTLHEPAEGARPLAPARYVQMHPCRCPESGLWYWSAWTGAAGADCARSGWAAPASEEAAAGRFESLEWVSARDCSVV